MADNDFVGIVTMRSLFCTQCRTPFHRDVMAASNMANAVQEYLWRYKRPRYLQPMDADGNHLWENGDGDGNGGSASASGSSGSGSDVGSDSSGGTDSDADSDTDSDTNSDTDSDASSDAASDSDGGEDEEQSEDGHSDDDDEGDQGLSPKVRVSSSISRHRQREEDCHLAGLSSAWSCSLG